MLKGTGAVGRPLDLSGRNSRLAWPIFHPPVAFRGHFSQRATTLLQHLAQTGPHRGLCEIAIFIFFFISMPFFPVVPLHDLPLPLSFPRYALSSRTNCVPFMKNCCQMAPWKRRIKAPRTIPGWPFFPSPDALVQCQIWFSNEMDDRCLGLFTSIQFDCT